MTISHRNVQFLRVNQSALSASIHIFGVDGCESISMYDVSPDVADSSTKVNLSLQLVTVSD